MARFDGKVAVVTRSGVGMGRSTALRLAREGARVVAADISGEEQSTALEVPDLIVPFKADVTRASDVGSLVAEATGRFGRLDIACNVVGVAGVAQAPLPEVDETEYDQVMAVNLKSVFLGMKFAIPSDRGDRRWVHHQRVLGRRPGLVAKHGRLRGVQGGDPGDDSVRRPRVG